MNRTPVVILASLLSCPFILAQDEGTNALPTNAIPIVRAQSADIFYNQSATVTGKVAQVTLRQSVIFLNLEKAYPDSPFTAVIFTKDTNQFGDLNFTNLMGKSVGITGFIKQYQNKPEIVVSNASQLKVLDLEKK
jgi:DNA/RNA endonuclease YhcR with UshA esterase domain